MSQNKTQPDDTDIAAYLAGVQPDRRRADAQRLDMLFRQITGFQPVLWGGAILGYGRYSYVYASGRAGEFLATGFAPRKANLSIYIMPGYAEFDDILARLGKHKHGKACLYVNKLDDIDLDVLAELIGAGLTNLGRTWPVTPS